MIAAWLSNRSIDFMGRVTPSSLNKYWYYSICFVMWVAATYSASAVDSVVVDCLFELHTIAPPASGKMYLLIAFQCRLVPPLPSTYWVISDAQSSMSPPYVSMWFIVPLRYLNMCFTVVLCVTNGFFVNCISVMTAHKKLGCVMCATYSIFPISVA